MAIVFGVAGGSALGWSAARAKVRGDLWRPGTSGVPEDVVDRSLHASLQEIEGERRWMWLENLLGSLTLEVAADFVDLPGSVQSITSLSYRFGGNRNPLSPVALATVRELSVNSASGFPSRYALTDGRIYFDTTLAAGSQLELIFTARCPENLEDAIDAPSITLSRHQQAVIALACHYIALSFLKNEEDAQRQGAAYARHLDRMMNTEDQQRGEQSGGGVRPDVSYQVAAFGR